MSKISDIAYARYQFDWMISHGYTVYPMLQMNGNTNVLMDFVN